jgi:hypothetical protein
LTSDIPSSVGQDNVLAEDVSSTIFFTKREWDACPMWKKVVWRIVRDPLVFFSVFPIVVFLFGGSYNPGHFPGCAPLFTSHVHDPCGIFLEFAIAVIMFRGRRNPGTFAGYDSVFINPLCIFILTPRVLIIAGWLRVS